jgi:hypothetical protein
MHAQVHFSCDERPDKGAFKDYVKGNGKTFICSDCAGKEEGPAAKKPKTEAAAAE